MKSMVRSVITGILLALPSLFFGCREEPDYTADETALLTQRLARLEARLSDAESARLAQQAQLAQKLEGQMAENRRTIDQLTIQLSETQRQLGDLESMLQKAQSELRELRKQTRQNQSLAPQAPILSETAAAAPARTTAADAFPALVEAISGQKVVTGTHTSTRMTPTDKWERDAMGNKVRVMKQEVFDVNEYNYQVGFSVKNLTATPQDLYVSAGSSVNRISLQPGEIITNAAVPSAMGADLSVRAGSATRRYPVAYKEE